jgi:hypothetical protein
LRTAKTNKSAYESSLLVHEFQVQLARNIIHS